MALQYSGLPIIMMREWCWSWNNQGSLCMITVMVVAIVAMRLSYHYALCVYCILNTYTVFVYRVCIGTNWCAVHTFIFTELSFVGGSLLWSCRNWTDTSGDEKLIMWPQLQLLLYKCDFTVIDICYITITNYYESCDNLKCCSNLQLVIVVRMEFKE